MFKFNFPGWGVVTSAPRPPGADGYPLDLDGALDYTRPALGVDIFPCVASYPNGIGIGTVSGFMPQQDAAVYAQLIARVAAGPNYTMIPNDPTRYTLQAVFPGLEQIGAEGVSP